MDAPEKGQAFGQKAKDFLGLLCFQKQIRIIVSGKDRYGRTIAESFTDDGRSLSNEMVRNGFAWQFKKYSKDKAVADMEENARKLRIGLWADPSPLYPPDFRAEKKMRTSRNKSVAAATQTP